MATPNNGSKNTIIALLITVCTYFGGVTIWGTTMAEKVPPVLIAFGIKEIFGVPIDSLIIVDSTVIKRERQRETDTKALKASVDTVKLILMGRDPNFESRLTKRDESQTRIKERWVSERQLRYVTHRIPPQYYFYQTKKTDEYGFEYILRAHRMSWKEFCRLNPKIKKYGDIRYGRTRLKLRWWHRHLVQPGQILPVLEDLFDIPKEEIKRANNITGIKVLRGEILNIPYPGVLQEIKSKQELTAQSE